jgi:hypothetical protein
VGKRNIDERLDRLNGRHEALTRSVELLTHHVRHLTADIDKLRRIVSESAGFINQLAPIDLEGGEEPR